MVALSRSVDLTADVSTLGEIEAAVRGLGDAELAAFRAWLDEYLADAWDRQIEADAAAGRLDALAEAALGDLRAGHCTDL